MRPLALAFTILLPLTVAAEASAQRCDVRREVSGTLDFAGLTGVLVAAEAGELEVIGSDRADIRVTGEVCASDDALAGDALLIVERRSDAAWVEADLPDSGWRDRYVRMDVRIEMPARLVADIRDGSGSIEVTGIAAARIDDGSDNIRVWDVGAVVIDDNSGGIRLERVGDVELSDNSGEIDIRGVTGTVRVLEDGSGSIDIQDVTGSVLIEEDGSGTIRVHRVGGDFTLERDGSGSVRYSDVRGRVSVPR